MPQRNRWIKRPLAIVLTLLIILPVFLFSVYELTSLNATENLLVETYNRQLDGVLTSTNQYAWDLVGVWAASMNRMMLEGTVLDTLLKIQVDRHQSVDGAFLADSSARVLGLMTRPGTSLDRPTLDRLIHGAAEVLTRMVQLRQAGYTRLQPFLLDSAAGDMRVVLLFPSQQSNGSYRLGGILIEPERFAREELGPRLLEAAGTQFIAAVFRTGTDQPVYATENPGTLRVVRRRTLWIFPRLEVGIRFRGNSAEEIAATRSRQLLMMIVGLDFLLITGTWLTYRNVRRETELARLKSDFVSNVSHELRTPLALIRMYAETLEMGRIQTDAKKREYYATIVSESGRLSRLVNNILNFSRMEAGRMPLTFREAEVNAVVRNSVEVWREQFVADRVQVVYELDSRNPKATVDVEAIGEALMNLIDNAIKYGGDQKYLGLATGADDRRVYIRVEDHGVGIPEKDHQRVFEMFYRSTIGVQGGARGSGVGLSIVRHIMNAHNGSVTLESTVGKGSIFTLWIPRS